MGDGSAVARFEELVEVSQVMECLEERYQAPVDAGMAERDLADRMLTDGFEPRCPKLAFVWVKPPWRVV